MSSLERPLKESTAAEGVSLPPAGKTLERSDVPAMLDEVKAWLGKKDEKAAPTLSMVYQWAKSAGIKLSNENVIVLCEVFKALEEAVGTGKKKEDRFGDFSLRPHSSLARALQREADEELAAKKAKAKLEEEDERRRRADNEGRTREEIAREQVHGLLLSKPIAKDGAGVQELEHLLTTNNLAPGDYLAVMAYLREVSEMQPATSVRVLTGSRGAA